MMVVRPYIYSQNKALRQVHTWPLWVVWIPRIKSNPPFFTLSINPHTLSSCMKYCISTHPEINYGHACNINYEFKAYKFKIPFAWSQKTYFSITLKLKINYSLKITRIRIQKTLVFYFDTNTYTRTLYTHVYRFLSQKSCLEEDGIWRLVTSLKIEYQTYINYWFFCIYFMANS